MDELIILDFETTGLSPDYAARIIEVGAVLVKNGEITEHFSQLMNPGFSIPYFITQITGITNQMVKTQPRPEAIMPLLKKFIGNRPILAHNAPFDKKFLLAEMANVGIDIPNHFLCTLKLSRRLIPNSPDYKLTTLIAHLKIKLPKNHHAHRALDDVISTFHLWTHIKKQVLKNININSFNNINKTTILDLFLKLEQLPKNKIGALLEKYI